MATHHYLPFRGLVGRSLLAVLGEHWLALIGWHAGAFKLKARDRWIGWLPEQQFRRLHLIANRKVRDPARVSIPSLSGLWFVNSPGVLPGGELAGAGANPGLCPQARHARDLGPARQTEGGPGLPAGARCARAASRLGRRAGVAKPGRPRAVDDEPAAKPVRMSSHRARFRGNAGGAIRWATILAIEAAGYHGTRASQSLLCQVSGLNWAGSKTAATSRWPSTANGSAAPPATTLRRSMAMPSSQPWSICPGKCSRKRSQSLLCQVSGLNAHRPRRARRPEVRATEHRTADGRIEKRSCRVSNPFFVSASGETSTPARSSTRPYTA